MIKKLIILSLALSASSIAYSANQFSTFHLESVNAFGTGNTFVIEPLANEFPAACNNQENGKRLYIELGEVSVSQQGMGYMLSTSLAALASNKPIYVRFNDSTEFCYVSRIMIRAN